MVHVWNDRTLNFRNKLLAKTSHNLDLKPVKTFFSKFRYIHSKRRK